MSKRSVKILLLADSHLGFDQPIRPRVERRRRGADFLANFERALQPALEGKVDLVVHGGDLFFRSRVPAAIIESAFLPLVRVAEAGVPVFLVPGNHERSRLPLHLWASHPGIHIFHRPATFTCRLQGAIVSMTGFPFARKIDSRFKITVEQARRHGVEGQEVDFRFLCLHQAVEGASVGPVDYTFRQGPEVIRGEDIPADFDAVLAGHIHRSQRLEHDLSGRPLKAPVIYPGSLERTSFAERFEDKHFVLIEATRDDKSGPAAISTTFVRLPARPMVVVEIGAADMTVGKLTAEISRRLAELPEDAVARFRLVNMLPEMKDTISAATLRTLAPPTMNVELDIG